MLEQMFALRTRGATVGTEVLAGATTFMVMAYIIFVNPAILSFAGVPGLTGQGPGFAPTLAATCLVAGVMHGAYGPGHELSPRHGLRHGPERRGRLPARRRTEAAVARGHGRYHPGGDHYYRARPHRVPHGGGRRHSSGTQACYWRGHWVVHPVYWPVLGGAGETGDRHPCDPR